MAFANYWIVPRLADFYSRHRNIDLRLQTTDKELDLATEGLSLCARRGNGHWSGYGSALLTAERLRPVAAPRFIGRHGEPRSLAELAQARLIHLEEPYRPRPTWHDWFAAHTTPFHDDDKGLRLNDYALVVQAAMAGEGIALGWAQIVEQLVAQGLLVWIGPWEHVTAARFYLVWPKTMELSPDAKAVRDWILEAAAVERNCVGAAS